MEIFQLNNNIKVIKCPECDKTSIIRINQDKLLLTGKCKNRHNIDDIKFCNFKFNCLKIYKHNSSNLCQNITKNLAVKMNSHFLCLDITGISRLQFSYSQYSS